MWLLALALPAFAASGLAEPQTGAWVDAHAGGAFAGGLGLGTDVSIGLWRGPYDPDYALGRYGGLGLGLRTAPGGVAPVFEARRGVDLLIVGLHGFAAGGWDVPRGAPLLEVGVGAKLRVRATGRYVGWQARLRGGATLAEEVVPHVALTVGCAFQGPFRAGGS